MTMDNQELKDFIGLAMTDLKINLTRLADSVDSLRSSVREIDIKTTTRIAELQKDVEDIRRDVIENKIEIKSVRDSQKFNWKTLTEEREQEKKDQATKDRMQAVINNQMSTINKVLWAIFGIVLSIFLGFLWQLLVNGGLKGLIAVP
jgi:predicted  nucleic acid-binding Zn-ribbon protein